MTRSSSALSPWRKVLSRNALGLEPLWAAVLGPRKDFNANGIRKSLCLNSLRHLKLYRIRYILMHLFPLKFFA